MSKLAAYLARYSQAVNHALHRYLPRETQKPRLIHKAMRYSVNAGGKRLRPVLVIAAAEACGGKARDVLPAACAIELIHTYSLIHDDLPAMDDDDLRRGRPTNHKVFGEDIAILAGDALLTHAFNLMAVNINTKRIDPQSIVYLIEIVSQAAGSLGMVGGQVADINADAGKWRKKGNSEFRSPAHLLRFIHLNKTAALIRASLLAGGILSGATRNKLSALDAFGLNLGLCFQITDDILDIVGNKKKMGKKGSDRTNQKLTYPALYGLDASQKMARFYAGKAHRAADRFRQRGDLFHQLIDYILRRDY